MTRNILIIVCIITFIFSMRISISATIQEKKPEITVIYTTDIHGNFFPFDFIQMADAPGSYARVATAVDSIRNAVGTGNVLLLDNGDILQGQPTTYYYNFIDTTSPHIAADIFNYMDVSAVTIGNHDIETGHAVYDRWRKQLKAPVLAANAINRDTEEPYFQPYAIFDYGGIRTAILGLLTEAIPAWLPENLWSGIRFDSMEESAEKWVKIIKQKESPDVIIGLFHSGRDATKTTAGYVENAAMTTAINVDGFDAVLMGHDHSAFCDTITNKSGKIVHLLNPSNNAQNIGILTISKINDKFNIKSQLIDIRNISPSEKFLKHFAEQRKNIETFVRQEIAIISDSIFTRDAFFGPSAFMTLLHNLQLQISGADISMAAPLSFDCKIEAGNMSIADMFTLYRYENILSTLWLTGREIKDYLEFSYSLWIEDITNIDNKHLIKFAINNPTQENNKLKNPSYNFDSAAGINYTVDITKPYGQKISITNLSSGKPFDMDSVYTVAINSYRAGGGGNHLTEGAGIPAEELKSRVIKSTDKDLRYYLMELLREKKFIKPTINSNWRFIPEEIASKSIEVDREIMFIDENSRNQKHF